MPPVLFAVRLEHGGPWDWSKGLREQDGWDEHARFMDALVDDGFILLGGPLEGDHDVLHVVDAPSEQEVHILTFRDDNARYLISLVTATRRQAPEAWQRNTDDMGAVMRSFTRK